MYARLEVNKATNFINVKTKFRAKRNIFFINKYLIIDN
jgi:hypothetical protein